MDSRSGANVVKTIFTHVREYIRSSPCLPTSKYHICYIFAYLQRRPISSNLRRKTRKNIQKSLLCCHPKDPMSRSVFCFASNRHAITDVQHWVNYVASTRAAATRLRDVTFLLPNPWTNESARKDKRSEPKVSEEEENLMRSNTRTKVPWHKLASFMSDRTRASSRVFPPKVWRHRKWAAFSASGS